MKMEKFKSPVRAYFALLEIVQHLGK